MIGDTFKPAAQQEPERRKAYDAPRWLDTDQKVPFSRLIEYSGQLTAKGYGDAARASARAARPRPLHGRQCHAGNEGRLPRLKTHEG